ncbi:MAG: shikimate kinase [Ruminococcus sp.]|nr:shikimate kinase [Ruminococcus sp.]MDY2742507.1 shikimate kinase [Eubacteriales bacterium]
MEYGLIGEKLGHSFSREIHNLLASYTYDLKELPKNELDTFMKSRNFKGVNVTIPYKESVIPYLDEIDEAAKAIGAVNTIVNREGRLIGYNTDFYGMRELLLSRSIRIEKRFVAVLGTGGTSKTACAVAKSLGASRIVRVSRNPHSDGDISYDELEAIKTDIQIIINTTPVGMYPNENCAPLDIDGFSALEGVVDAIYNPLRTKLISDARARQIRAAGGLYMLVAQAARAAELFTGDCNMMQKTEKAYCSILKNKQNIVLVGMPGSGKSTLGRMLAKKTGKAFYDSDSEIEKQTGMCIPDYFSKYGEDGFRAIETDVIKRLSLLGGIVIATGGGAVIRSENIDSLAKNGIIVYLDRPISDIKITSNRPLTRSVDDLKKKYYERHEMYEKSADITVMVKGSEKSTLSTLINALKDVKV